LLRALFHVFRLIPYCIFTWVGGEEGDREGRERERRREREREREREEMTLDCVLLKGH
jgi:hypothetical protein